MRNKGQEVTKLARKSSMVLVEKVDGSIWVSEAHFAIKLTNNEYLDFVKKFSSYKNTAIPPINLDEDTCYVARAHNTRFETQEPLIKTILNYDGIICPENLIEKTSFLQLISSECLVRIYVSTGKEKVFRAYQQKFVPFIDICEEVYTDIKHPLKPLFGFKKGELILTLMPVKHETLEEDIQKLAS